MNTIEFAPERHMNFYGKDWAILKAHLAFQLENRISELCTPGVSHDDTNVTRGYIKAIRDILALENAASNSRNEEI